MIKFKRGSTDNWNKNLEVIADGQPAYDKDRHKLKVGDGIRPFILLPDVSGLFRNEILESNAEAQKSLLSDPIFTYGDTPPDQSTEGEVYFQKYEGAVEADYVVEFGRDTTGYFRKWNSGFIECWGVKSSEFITNAKKKFTSTFYDVTSGNNVEMKGFWK